MCFIALFMAPLGAAIVDIDTVPTNTGSSCSSCHGVIAEQSLGVIGKEWATYTEAPRHTETSLPISEFTVKVKKQARVDMRRMCATLSETPKVSLQFVAVTQPVELQDGVMEVIFTEPVLVLEDELINRHVCATMTKKDNRLPIVFQFAHFSELVGYALWGDAGNPSTVTTAHSPPPREKEKA